MGRCRPDRRRARPEFLDGYAAAVVSDAALQARRTNSSSHVFSCPNDPGCTPPAADPDGMHALGWQKDEYASRIGLWSIHGRAAPLPKPVVHFRNVANRAVAGD